MSFYIFFRGYFDRRYPFLLFCFTFFLLTLLLFLQSYLALLCQLFQSFLYIFLSFSHIWLHLFIKTLLPGFLSLLSSFFYCIGLTQIYRNRFVKRNAIRVRLRLLTFWVCNFNHVACRFLFLVTVDRIAEIRFTRTFLLFALYISSWGTVSIAFHFFHALFLFFVYLWTCQGPL